MLSASPEKKEKENTQGMKTHFDCMLLNFFGSGAVSDAASDSGALWSSAAPLGAAFAGGGWVGFSTVASFGGGGWRWSGAAGTVASSFAAAFGGGGWVGSGAFTLGAGTNLSGRSGRAAWAGTAAGGAVAAGFAGVGGVALAGSPVGALVAGAAEVAGVLLHWAQPLP